MTKSTQTADLKRVYLQTFDEFSVHGVTTVTGDGINTRYARELLATLVNLGLLLKDTDEDGGDMWQCIQTYDNITREEAESLFDATIPLPAAPEIEVNGVSFNACRCGCGQPIGKKSMYRPGHDARHAGQVGREAWDLFLQGQGHWDSREFYDGILPTEALKAKARGVATKLADKQMKKDLKAKRKERTGTVKIGRWAYPARMDKDLAVRNTKRDGSGDWVEVLVSNVDWD